MEFWIIWGIGVIITIVTKTLIKKWARETEKYSEAEKRESVYRKDKKARWLVHILVAICINVVGGIIVAKWIASVMYFEEGWTLSDIILFIFAVIVAIVLTYCVGWLILRLDRIDEKLEKIWITIFLISIISWLIPIDQYNKNIETVEETNVGKEERKLIYFCNVPVQEVSGVITGNRYTANGEITTSDNLPYWYLDGDGKGKYDSAVAERSDIVFIQEGTYYVEISYYNKKTISINHNNGKKEIISEENWEEYTFYLPEAIMQYNLN